MHTSRQCESVCRGVSIQGGVATLILMLVCPWLIGRAHPLATPLIFNVVANNVTSTSATITWSTTKPADTQVAYFIGTAKPTWSKCCSPTNATAHSLTLTGLALNTTYNFFVESTATGSSTSVDSTTSTFHTSGGFSISNVLATNVTASTARITWTTSQPADTQVAYFVGIAKPTWSACCKPTNVTSHSFTLTGLAADTTYNFFVESTATGSSMPADSGTSTLRTARLPQSINLGPGQSPDLVVDGNENIDLAWTDAGAVFARSADSGTTFTTTRVSTGGSLTGEMTVDDLGHINLLSVKPDALGRNAFSLDTSNDGTSFSSTDVSSLIIRQAQPEVLAAPSGAVNLPELSASNGIYDAVVAQKRVVTVSQDFDVDFELTAASGPQGQIYVAWEKQSDAVAECAIMFSASLDGGVTFSQPHNVSNNPAECAEFPQLNVDAAGRVNLAWTTIPGFEDNNGPLVNPNELYFARSTDQGQTWSTPTPLVGINQFTGQGDDFSGVGDPQIATEPNGAIDVVFDATSSTDTIALFARSTDGGRTFSVPFTLGTGGANSPVVAIDSCGGINVIYAGAADIFFRRSTDGGSTFAPPTNRSNSGVSEFNPLIAIGGKNAYITWEDSTNVYFQTIKVCP
jgi:hypothetical protein